MTEPSGAPRPQEGRGPGDGGAPPGTGGEAAGPGDAGGVGDGDGPLPLPGALSDIALPGLRDLLAGRRRRGGLVLGGWFFLWGVVVVRSDRIAATIGGGSPGEWIALASLAAGMAACWWAAEGPAAADGARRGEGPGPAAGRKGGGAEGPSSGAPGPGPGPRGAGFPAAGRPAGARPDLLRRFLRHRQATLGLVLLAGLAAAALLTPYLAPHDPQVGDRIVETRYQAPSVEHPMGTDRFGRDVFSRVLYGARISLGIGLTAVLIAISLGTLVGAVAGYVGGWTDTVAMRLVDMLLSFPRLVLLITLVALFEPSVALVTAVLGATGWMGTSRIVRGEVLSIREEEYVEAARALGYGDARILLRHVLPNALTPVIVSATLGVGNTILAEAALSFLGLGVQPPAASWGTMVAAGRDVMLEAWWITLFPGLAIVFTVMSFNLVGDGLRDALDPRHAPGT